MKVDEEDEEKRWRKAKIIS